MRICAPAILLAAVVAVGLSLAQGGAPPAPAPATGQEGKAATVGNEGKAPAPLEVPAAWQLDIEVQTPRPIQVVLPGESRPTTFWYVLYAVINQYRDPISQQPTDQIFVPDFTLYTDTGQLMRAGKRAPNVVYEAIKRHHNNPHLKDMVAITGKILFGEDNAKDGVAIWRNFDPDAGTIDIFVGGLSGEIVEIDLPKPVTVTRIDDTGKPVTKQVSKLRLVKTLQLRYKVPGEAKARLHTPVKLITKKWIMR